MASTKCVYATARSCVKDYIPRFPSCGGWVEVGGGNYAREASVWCVGREKAKLSYFWEHCYLKGRSGRYRGALINPDTGCPIETDGGSYARGLR